MIPRRYIADVQLSKEVRTQEQQLENVKQVCYGNILIFVKIVTECRHDYRRTRYLVGQPHYSVNLDSLFWH